MAGSLLNLLGLSLSAPSSTLLQGHTWEPLVLKLSCTDTVIHIFPVLPAAWGPEWPVLKMQAGYRSSSKH